MIANRVLGNEVIEFAGLQSIHTESTYKYQLDDFDTMAGCADMIVAPCPVCQMNVEVYQDKINAKYGTKFNIPVTYYSTLMSVAYGKTGKQAGLDGQIIRAKKLEEIASK